MTIEIRDDGAHISGYVNITEKKSKPVITPHGKVVEEIEERAFGRAISRAGNIPMTVDHMEHVYAQTSDGTLELREDAVGLHANAIITDENLIAIAKAGKIRGWSFGMYNVSDELEARTNELPIRHVKELDLDHITLVVHKKPAYSSATIVEMRTGEETDIEERGLLDTDLHISDERAEEPAPGQASENEPQETPIYDNSAYKIRAYKLRADALRKNKN